MLDMSDMTLYWTELGIYAQSVHHCIQNLENVNELFYNFFRSSRSSFAV